MLQEKIALVTGASRGNGKATALALAKHGATVIVNYLRSEEGARAVVEQIQDAGGSAMMIQADVADTEQVTRMFHQVMDGYGKLDILVNNAGAIVRPAGWQDLTDDVWNRSLDINLKGAFTCIRTAVPCLTMSGEAAIINITSTFGALIGSPNIVAYAAAKAALLSLTCSFAKALGPNIRVNCVAPGIIDTDMTAGSPPSFVQQQVERTPLKRIGKPEDVADTVLYLASPWSRFVTGQMIVVDGGHSLR